MKNKYCELKDIGNEATVEARFVDKMIDDFGFQPSEVKLKTSLVELKVGKGSKSALYKPDYVVLASGLPEPPRFPWRLVGLSQTRVLT